MDALPSGLDPISGTFNNVIKALVWSTVSNGKGSNKE